MSKDKQAISLGEGNINRLMLKYSIPCIMSLLISSLYNIVDQMFIGNSSLSTLGNAATGVVFPIFIIAQAFAWCFGDGCAAYLNIVQGKNETGGVHKALGGSITVTGFYRFEKGEGIQKREENFAEEIAKMTAGK